MTYDLFPTDASTTNPAVLADKIADYRLTQPPLAGVTDKWLLASNLQKAIRRGLTCNAIASALALQAIDSRYFWRRLLVIAYEDVGVANIGLCHDLLKSFRREALHLRLGHDRIAAYFAEALAKSLKSRTLCDAIAMLEFDPRLPDVNGDLKLTQISFDQRFKTDTPPSSGFARHRCLGGWAVGPTGKMPMPRGAQSAAAAFLT